MLRMPLPMASPAFLVDAQLGGVLQVGGDNAAQMTRQKGIAATKRPFRDTDLAMRRVFPFEARLAQDRSPDQKKEN
jgi:hypothetical protein